MISDRGLAVLRAIVQDYVDLNEPVGSKAVVERHGIGVSAATVRNEMALLEEAGLIHAPHTSAGRVPTDLGYRVFVDHLTKVRPLTTAQRNAIVDFLSGPTDIDELLSRTVRALTRLTGQVAVVQYPTFGESTLTHVELVALATNRFLIVLVTDAGAVSQRIITVASEVHEAELSILRALLAELVTGYSVTEGITRTAQFTPRAGIDAEVQQRLVGALGEELAEFRTDRIVMAGAANLARRERDFSGSIQPLLEALEEQVTLLRLMSEMDANSEGLSVSIGSENAGFGLDEASVVTSTYQAPAGIARIGVMGPTRMDYSGNLAAARAVAQYLTRLLEADEHPHTSLGS